MSDIVFVNRFWGTQDGGFRVIQSRLHHSLATLTELLQFYKDRLAIEKEYNKKMTKLVNSVTLGSRETGSIKVAMEKLQLESNNMLEQNQKFIRSTSLHNFEKLQSFYQTYQKNVNKIEVHMEKILTKKRDSYIHLEASKEKYRSDCNLVKSLQLICQTTWGKELEKNTTKLNKVQLSIHSSRDAYVRAVEKCNEIHEIWVRDWRTALSNIYQLEIERIQVCKLNCFTFCNHIATLCVDWDQLVDMARTSFAKIAAPKDVHDFAEAHGTSDKIPAPPKFIDFSSGYDEDSENVDFNVATFKDPDFAEILTRTFSTQSTPSKGRMPQVMPPQNGFQPDGYSNGYLPSPEKPQPVTTPQRKPPSTLLSPPKDKSLPPIIQTGSQNQGPESHGLRKQPSQNSAYTSGQDDGNDDDDDVFDSHPRNPRSSTGLDFSNPTNYTSNTVRSWASPKKRERLEMQDRINRRLRDWTNELPRQAPPPVEKPNIPIAKDFSMDFIAKALEDLNAGGDGDVNQFRRSVRSQRSQQQHEPQRKRNSLQPSSRLIDDSQEIAQRLDSISFHTPTRPRPKSMVESVFQPDDALPRTVIKKQPETKRFSLQSPTKSFVDLHSMIDEPQPQAERDYVTKAKAIYSYKSREEGELSFRKGWNMFILHKQEDNWYICELGDNCGSERGNVGLVPYNYIREGDDVF